MYVRSVFGTREPHRPLGLPRSNLRLVTPVSNRLPPGIEWDTHGVEALTVFVSEIPIGLYLHKTLAFIASVGIAGASGTKSVVAAFVEGDDHARVRILFDITICINGS